MKRQRKNLPHHRTTAPACLSAGTWYLWWREGHSYDTWPAEKPALIAYFNSLGIVHPDDMSCISMACFYRKVHNQPLDIEGQVEYYQDYWRKAGFIDGVPK